MFEGTIGRSGSGRKEERGNRADTLRNGYIRPYAACDTAHK